MSLIATLITNPVTPVLSSKIANLAANAIESSGPQWLAPDIACDLMLPQESILTDSEVHAAIKLALGDAPIDIVVQSANNRRKKALIADMDSTMIDQECIDELADVAGIKDKVSAITARAMNGEIEFEAALRERVTLLAGLNVSVIDKVMSNNITFAAGGKKLVATMKAHGAYCALVSGGFTTFTRKVAAQMGFDENRANTLLEENGKLSGKVLEPILGQQAKVDALNEIASTHGFTPADFIAVGDGANDLGMLGLAGSGVALHAKPSVAQRASIRIDHGDLTALLYIQGYLRSEIVS